MEQNFYDLLDISPFATQDEIAKAFKLKMTEYNKKKKPQKSIGDLITAYQTLISPDSKSEYDSFIDSSIVQSSNPVVLQKEILVQETHSNVPSFKVSFSDLTLKEKSVFTKIQDFVRKGTVNKVQIKWGDKVILPPIPLAVFLAAEAATFIGAGLIRTVLANVATTTLLDVEFLNNAESHYDDGVRRYESGDLEEALEEFNQCLKIDPNHEKALLKMGVIFKAMCNLEIAKNYFIKVLELDSHGDSGRAAKDQLRKIGYLN